MKTEIEARDILIGARRTVPDLAYIGGRYYVKGEPMPKEQVEAWGKALPRQHPHWIFFEHLR